MSACARFVCVAKVGVELHLDGITNMQRAETWKKRKHSSVWGPLQRQAGSHGGQPLPSAGLTGWQSLLTKEKTVLLPILVRRCF